MGEQQNLYYLVLVCNPIKDYLVYLIYSAKAGPLLSKICISARSLFFFKEVWELSVINKVRSGHKEK